MSYLPWNKPIRHTLASPTLLKQRGRGVVFHYGTKQLGPTLWSVQAFRENVLVFLGLAETEAGLTIVLEDAKKRPHWQHACWELTDNLPSIESLELWGTPFQQSVWEALMTIKAGEKSAYQTIAKSIHRPKALRAVGTAVGANTISGFVPCHRVLPKSGGVGNYRWGAEIKKHLLQEEKV